VRKRPLATESRPFANVPFSSAGRTVLATVRDSGVNTSHIQQVGREGRTAQYVAVNDTDKSLVMAMADMNIVTQHAGIINKTEVLLASSPKWLVVDANWTAADIQSWIRAARQQGARVAFEPVSVEKAARLFDQVSIPTSLGVHPTPILDIAAPNQYELTSLFEAAKKHEHLDTPAWFDIIDAFNMRGARDKFVKLTSAAITDKGIPQQTIQLLPYIPTLITKLGAEGALLTMLLGPDDPRLRDPDALPWILTRNEGDHPSVGGVYMRLFPAVEKVEDMVSVNGVGDTFLGAVVAGLVQGGRIEDLIDIAQKAAVITLRSKASVGEDLSSVREALRRITSGP
jgi:pseudouridylate synthase / pseudouridine kinase